MDKQKDFEKGWEEYKVNKQKQIEEMAKDICSPCHKGKLGLCEPNKGCVVLEYEKNAVETGYRKIPENAVVLTREKYIEMLDEIKVSQGKLLEMLKTVEKKTAEKFAKKLKKDCVWRNDFDHEGVAHPYTILDLEELDEICKEITGSEKNGCKHALKDELGDLYCGNDKSENLGDFCVVCGEYVPEGRQVCPNCENKEERNERKMQRAHRADR